MIIIKGYPYKCEIIKHPALECRYFSFFRCYADDHIETICLLDNECFKFTYIFIIINNIAMSR